MTNFDTAIFLQFFIAILTVFLTIFLKVVSRNDRIPRFRRDDLAFGFDISSTALVLFVLGMVNLATKITSNSPLLVNMDIKRLLSAPWILFAFFIGTWSISTLNRWYGWERDEPHLIWGIAIPNFWGLFVLTFAVLLIGHYL